MNDLGGATETDAGQVLYRLEIAGDLDRQAIEALQLEIRCLAKRYGIDITKVRIERVMEKMQDLST